MCSSDLHAPGREEAAFLRLLELRKHGWPNTRMVEFADQLLKRDGALMCGLLAYRRALIQAKPQALFSLLYAGDLSAFINQGNVYALFSQMTVATPNVDYPVMAAIKQLPAGIQSGTRPAPRAASSTAVPSSTSMQGPTTHVVRAACTRS